MSDRTFRDFALLVGGRVQPPATGEGFKSDTPEDPDLAPVGTRPIQRRRRKAAVHTVKNHLHNRLVKLAVNTRAKAAESLGSERGEHSCTD